MNAVSRIGSQPTNGTKISKGLTKDWIRLQDVHVAPNVEGLGVRRSYKIILPYYSNKSTLPLGQFRDAGQLEIRVTRPGNSGYSSKSVVAETPPPHISGRNRALKAAASAMAASRLAAWKNPTIALPPCHWWLAFFRPG
jgi:hypothetical protein